MPQLSSPIFSSNHSSSLTSTTDTSVRSALHTWKSARTLLADAIQSYLSACATLNVACTRPTHTPLERTVVEDALVAVDSELTSLTSEAKALRDAQVGLSTLRNKSGKLTRINALPPEILTYIFKLSTVYCMRDKAAKGCCNALARVDIYWRQLALDTPELWTHIDLSPDAPNGRSLYDASKLQLERAKNELVHLHLYEPKQQYGSLDVEVHRLRDFLAPYAPRISALDLHSLNRSQSLIHSVLGVCIEGGFSTLQHLRVRVPESIYHLYLNIREPVGKKAKKHSIAIKTLHLKNAVFNWKSTIYHGLVGLRLQAAGEAHMHVSLPDLANVFARSPALVTLKLSGIVIGNWFSDQDRPPPVVLESLEVLNLVDLSPDNLRLVLYLIAQPKASARLSTGLTFYENEPKFVYREFFERCHVSTLYHESDAEYLQLAEIPPSIDRLIVFKSDVTQQPAIGQSGSLDSSASASHHIPYVTLVSCVVTPEGLVSLIADLDIQVLRLDCCLIDRLMDSEGSIHYVTEEITTSLLEVYPNLICSISDVDSTLHLLCRAMFDC